MSVLTLLALGMSSSAHAGAPVSARDSAPAADPVADLDAAASDSLASDSLASDTLASDTLASDSLEADVAASARGTSDRGVAAIPIGGCNTPYIPCETYGQVWDSQKCQCVDGGNSPWLLSMSPNDAANLHNALLANDVAVRGDAARTMSVDDMAAFLEVGADYLCAQDPSYPAPKVADRARSYLESYIQGDFDAARDTTAMIDAAVANGVYSPELGAALVQLSEDATVLPADEVLRRIDEDLANGGWKGQDALAVTTLQAVEHASYGFWGGGSGGAAQRPGGGSSNVTDALWEMTSILAGELTLDPFLIFASPLIGAIASDLASKGIAEGDGNPTHGVDYAAVEGSYTFGESVLVNGQAYTLDGELTSEGVVVSLRDAKGNALDDAMIDASGTLLKGNGTIGVGQGGEEKGVIVVPIFTPWGFVIIIIIL